MRDDDGDFLALGKSLFWAPWGYKFDQPRLARNLDFLRGRVDYVRALGSVIGWGDRAIDPRWPDYEDVIAGTTDLIYEYGMRTQWTVFGGSDEPLLRRADRERIVGRFINMSATRREKVFAWEVVNEGWQTGFQHVDGISEARAHARTLRSATPHLVAITAPRIEAEAAEYYRDSTANFMTLHLDRDQTGEGELWRPVRQPWEIQFVPDVPKLWSSNEPIGPQSSVAADDDPLRLTMSAALTWLCGGAAYVYHTAGGIYGGGNEPPAHHAANLWEVRHIHATLVGMNVRRLLPADLPNWQRHNANHRFPNHPFDTTLLEPLHGAAFLRMFAASSGNDFVVMPIDIQREVPCRAKDRMTFDVFDPLTGEKWDSVALSSGQTYRLQPDVEAVVIIGKYR